MDIDYVITTTWCSTWDKKYELNFPQCAQHGVCRNTGTECKPGRRGHCSAVFHLLRFEGEFQWRMGSPSYTSLLGFMLRFS